MNQQEFWNTLDTLRQSAAHGADTAGKLAGDAAQSVRRNAEIMKLQAQIDQLYKELGQTAYADHIDGSEDTAARMSRIGLLNAKKQKLDYLRNQNRESQEQRSAVVRPARVQRAIKKGGNGKTYPYEAYTRSADYLRRQIGDFRPEVLLILGSGLGFLGDEAENPIFVNYSDIPEFKHSTAPGHKGRFVFGTLAGKRVAIMQGRMHTYEGYTMEDVAYAVRVVRLLGAETMLVTNAAGAVNTDFAPGDIMLITDHIKLCAPSPLTGMNLPEFGVRFPDMSHAYDPALIDLAEETARAQDLTLRRGVYMFFPGPQFETPAEIRAARILGADAAGMSTVPEVLCANHCGMRVLGFSLCANMAAGVSDHPLNEQEVLDAADAAKEPFSALVRGCLEKL